MFKQSTGVFLISLTLLLIILFLLYRDFSIKLEKLEDADGEKFNLTNRNEFIIVPNRSESGDTQGNEGGYPPCPSFGTMRWLHDPSTGECYEVGGGGNCGELMTFYQDPDNDLIGQCDCDDIIEVKSSNPECESVERPLVYFPPEQRCFTVFSQGPCLSKEWLVFSNFTPTCETNPCLHKKGEHEDEDEFSLKFWISHEKKCFETNSRAYCKKGEILKVSKNDWKPSCQPQINDMCPLSSSVSVPILECRPGNKLYQSGKCKKPK